MACFHTTMLRADRCEGRRSDHVTGGVDPRCAGQVVVVDDDPASIVEFDAGRFEGETAGVTDAVCGQQHDAPIDSCRGSTVGGDCAAVLQLGVGTRRCPAAGPGTFDWSVRFLVS